METGHFARRANRVLRRPALESPDADGPGLPVRVGTRELRSDADSIEVLLKGGPHTVHLRYHPAGLEPGILISVAVGLVLAASWWVDRSGPVRARGPVANAEPRR